MERKIGEIFEYNGEWYQCIRSSDCPKCDLKSIKDCRLKFPCESLQREDCEEVIFKKLEKIGEPVTERGRTFQCLKPWYIACTGCVFLGSNQCCDKDHYIDSPCYDWEIWTEIKQIKEDMEKNNNAKHSNFEKIGKNLKPFSLEAAKLGKPVCTRDGRKARIICFDRNDLYPIVALIECEDGKEMIGAYSKEGKTEIYEIKGTDLIMLPEKKEGWVNVYYDNDASSHRGCRFIYDTKEQAVKEAGSAYITTIKINWEE